ncbi:hypothetical protein A2631_01965 [Candidatus Daviesbacteria bacterium RIFCSPHIGHO2_01_FULL_44_29]|uniref:Excinuclease ABC subunit C n=1 Tax=Candidatus Daviesbacteria bacterium RIFCSPHIGHO2_02_FULL_43_12 TaxID=1797776 RepID=A0A1F5KJT8_9BACT|nr:MAG: hypothetical protein A2631_01965 [Candidatus Daviesbacteria bacterium RIFCSPHIGHO2_01_FULL_44_29]OGE39561.1 MAG: hypothetical protein A3E86_01940 [Candidatus Daviesbacteria bacterium RIFCSPHIGHO2_12_FULL_47_45]OGE41162.1 MAG: hypothetical protein A3D25_01360 [Candidatus Daviesbacteria bacterium RIFCSPHIGHO2_02_FULL_43_12]OGE69361.1 MAG: hypothetical protein A3B55_03100 [Candidatus Daviesbacteria bacterium RIFCSPLOWO2_01_FULL_43_15]
MVPAFIKEAKLPQKPGIYIYRNQAGQIIYVGKANNLKSRVSSYFAKTVDSLKTANLVSEIRSMETIIVESELEALILEANLIKKHLPLFNIRLIDDKDYLYIKFTQGDFPQVVTARKQELKEAKRYFGPFPSSRTVRETLKSLRRIFPWCSAPPKIVPRIKGQESSKKQLSSMTLDSGGLRHTRPCFYYHLGLCPGACTGEISKQEYHKSLHRLGMLLDGHKQELVRSLEQEMDQYSKAQQYEAAIKVRKMLSGISYLTQPNRTAMYLENPNFLEGINSRGLSELQKYLQLPSLPERIEAYDISNISGTAATGSMVVLINGEIEKSQYRKFKIIITGKPNDYAMHQEIMRRRLGHPEWPYPNLFLIDGGRGQVRASLLELKKRNISIPIFGLAKRMEWVYPPDGAPIKLPLRSLGLRLLQKIRDEAHRFAITYHRKLRAKAFLPS